MLKITGTEYPSWSNIVDTQLRERPRKFMCSWHALWSSGLYIKEKEKKSPIFKKRVKKGTVIESGRKREHRYPMQGIKSTLYKYCIFERDCYCVQHDDLCVRNNRDWLRALNDERAICLNCGLWLERRERGREVRENRGKRSKDKWRRWDRIKGDTKMKGCGDIQMRK